MSNQFDQLKKLSTIVCDSGDPELVKASGSQDATTNPSLILKVAQEPKFQELLNEAVVWGIRQNGDDLQTLSFILDKIQVNFALEIIKNIPGRISLEIDARLSFNVEAMVQRAVFLSQLFEAMGGDKKRLLVKIPGTWEGIRAVEFLEAKGIACNVTLIFNLVQAIAAAKAKATLISPFVGRIYDWWIAAYGDEGYSIDADPGVASVSNIYAYYKKFGIPTQIMAASFRTKEQVLALAGCDLLTISPKLLDELKKSQHPVKKELDPAEAKKLDVQPIELTESFFRFLMNEDAMATEKLAEGIRIFAGDTQILETAITEFIKQIAAEGA
ncbi:transaldolase [Chlamydia pneumoniae TW-183]|uniref:Transaldolase n=4 Tax=Chlamydia pneumoniae TaxID=83558 RepID=TAL_CHLPN|nr:transaldolase [Chlamydia pneumoniae]Q9Z998.1 RecName: Full=Transaldolase [Chlamydia pneumoniae]AAD18236.1 Transaldolase [Chlamydia pneumoniae CWL029]AAP98016.1 transaldolase [Chlamydia pneumoniae TW-183]CRI32579.1 Transaldolase [Chlamydia pneumoniae]CRI35440.1 Transaldolase [Chlamydia pneumoniae]CRI36566.1 Transaldolase [Chlamydia pneumoniae]